MSIVAFGESSVAAPHCAHCDQVIGPVAVVWIARGPRLLALHPGCAAELSADLLRHACAAEGRPTSRRRPTRVATA